MNLQRAIEIARLALAFSRVARATRHEDGVRPEMDSDHVVMLALMVLEFCPERFEVGDAVGYAVIHDLVEAYAGDTPTLVLDAAGHADKAAREAAALARLRVEFVESPILHWLETYERQDAPEARFVRVMDKVLPKLTHLLNECAAARAFTTKVGFHDAHARQLAGLTELYPDQPEALVLLGASMRASERAWPAEDAPDADLGGAPVPARWCRMDPLDPISQLYDNADCDSWHVPGQRSTGPCDPAWKGDYDRTAGVRGRNDTTDVEGA